MKIKVVYEDANILAIEKPSGILVHPDQKNKEKTILDLFLKKYPKIQLAHRLDRETSGVMLVAKTKAGHKSLKEQFQSRTIIKKYLAFARGEIKDQFGIINRPIGRSSKDFRAWSAARGARGEMREAQTWYELIAYRSGYSFLEIEPKTGRTHQIRVHFKAINHPIVADSLYGSDKAVALGFERLALHAYSIEFSTSTGKKISIKSPLPTDFINALEELGIAEVAKKRGLC